MLFEATTLATVARVIGESFEQDYGLSTKSLFAQLGIDESEFLKPGARVPVSKMDMLWREAVKQTSDPWFGFAVGKRARPGDFYVLGHAWLASETLKGALDRLCRYGEVLTMQGSMLTLRPEGDNYVFSETYPEGAAHRQQAAKDAGFVALLNLCDIVTQEPVRPIRALLSIPAEFAAQQYSDLFQCSVSYGAENDSLVYRADDLEQALVGSIPDVAQATDRIAADYVRSLDSGTVATAVRTMLIKKLPSGRADQESVANLLHRSRSTLQRQLRAEGTSYKKILETTRRALAERYLEEAERSQAEIAFMTGFADQSNFARAFKRWTGSSPGEYRKSISAG